MNLKTLFILALLAPISAFAVDLKITCTPPTTYEDGTPIPAGTVLTYSLYGAQVGQPKTKLVNAATSCSFTRTNVVAGTHEYYATATAAGLESAPSATVTKVVLPPDGDGDGVPDASDACPTVKGTLANGCNPSPPKSPTSLSVSETVAFEIRPNSQGTLVATRIGVVPQGALCSAESRVVGTDVYYRVDPRNVDLVNWPQQVKPVEAWAKCG